MGDVDLCGISIFIITCSILSTGNSLSRLSYGTRDAFEHHVHGAPGRARIGTGTDSEIKRPGPLATSKIAATSCRLRRVFGPHGIDRYNLYPDTDQVSVRWEQQRSCYSMLSTYSLLPIYFPFPIVPKYLFESPTPPYSL
jgi:hypothetical protein